MTFEGMFVTQSEAMLNQKARTYIYSTNAGILFSVIHIDK
jgi:hypothetical protein